MEYQEQMSNTIDEMKHLFNEMKMFHDATKDRQAMWEKLIAEQTNNNKERLDMMERKWGYLMKITITLLGIFLMSFVRDTIAISNRPTSTEVTKMINDGDYSTKSDVMRGSEEMIDGIYDELERHTDITDDASYVNSENLKIKVNQKITDYNPRSIGNGN